MNTEKSDKNPFPEIRLLPQLERVVGAIKHVVFRYPNEPFASHGDHFVVEPQEV